MKNELDYVKVGVYYLPDLVAERPPFVRPKWRKSFLRNWFIVKSNKEQRRTYVSVLRCFMVPRRERLKLSDTHFAAHFQFP